MWHFVAASLVLFFFILLCNARVYRPGDVFTIKENIQIAEAQAWWKGQLDLSERKWDSAVYNGKVYSHFPPLFSFLSALTTPFYDGVPHWFVLGVVVLPIPILAYAVMRRVVPHTFDAKEVRRWGAFLALGLVCGTSALPVLEKTLRGASPYFVNQALALTGVLVFLREYFGKRRLALAGAGIIVAAWSRQMTLAYFLPLAWMAFRSTASAGAGLTEKCGDQGLRFAPPQATNLGPYQGRVARTPHSFMASMVSLGLTGLLAVGVPMAMNWLKFEHPLESGYMYVYEGREDDIFVRDARAHGLFSTWYLPRNLYYANLGLPEIQGITRGEQREWYLTPNDWGTGIWWTTPLLLYLFADWRRIIGSPRERALLIGAGLAYIGLMMYHSSGFEQRGLNRYSLDYLPALYAMAAPASVATARRKWLTAGMVAWGLFYFASVRHWPQLRIW